MSKHDEMDPEEEAKLIQNYRKIVEAFNAAKAKGTLPKEGSFKGLKGGKLKGWEEQIQQMKSRIERYTREHGKGGRRGHH